MSKHDCTVGNSRTIQSMLLDLLRKAGRILETTKKLKQGIDPSPNKEPMDNPLGFPPGLFGKLDSLARILMELEDHMEGMASMFGIGYGEDPHSCLPARSMDEIEALERAREMPANMGMGSPEPRTYSRR